MQKEILTKDNIISDFKHNFLFSIKSSIISLFVLIAVSIIILLLFTPYGNSYLIIKLLLLSPCVFMCCILSSIIIESLVEYYKIINKNFEIKRDIVVDTIEKRTYFFSSFAASFSRPYSLIFSTYGAYHIPEGENNSSSKIFSMSDSGVFNYTCVGDEFFLIVDKNKKILLAYNTKMFDLQETTNGQHES